MMIERMKIMPLKPDKSMRNRLMRLSQECIKVIMAAKCDETCDLFNHQTGKCRLEGNPAFWNLVGLEERIPVRKGVRKH